jgi:hypothetical protein
MSKPLGGRLWSTIFRIGFEVRFAWSEATRQNEKKETGRERGKMFDQGFSKAIRGELLPFQMLREGLVGERFKKRRRRHLFMARKLHCLSFLFYFIFAMFSF